MIMSTFRRKKILETLKNKKMSYEQKKEDVFGPYGRYIEGQLVAPQPVPSESRPSVQRRNRYISIAEEKVDEESRFRDADTKEKVMDYVQVRDGDEEADADQEVPMFCSQPPILATKSTHERLNTTETQRITLKLKQPDHDSVDSLDKETQRTVSEQQFATVSEADTKTFQTGQHARDFIDDKQSDFEQFLDGD